jgi:site-specific DNA recombinase
MLESNEEAAMITAVYARKSTEQNGVNEEEKSVTRQIEHAKAYASKKGWIVSDEHVFVDDGISGAEFVKRPGFIRLMNALKPRPPFQILIMSEESRLGREQIETAYALKQITDAGVRIFFYLEDRERTLDSALDKVMLSLTGFAAEMERERAKQRTYDAMLRKAKAGHVTGGKVFGYDNKEVLSADGRRLHVLRVVNEEQAAVVRRIFQMFNERMGLGRIAKQLNEEQVPPPRSTSGWCPTAIRELLLRPLYRGLIVWGELQKYENRGTKKRRRRLDKDLIKVEVPDLRIVPEDLWAAVQERFQVARRVSEHYQKRGIWRDRQATYLLSGLGRCAHCGGPIQGISRDFVKGTGRTYGCVYHRKRGAAICQNALRVDQDRIDKALLRAIGEALDERVLELAVEKALFQLRAGDVDRLSRRQSIERELSLIEAYEKNLVDAIAKGEQMDPLLVKLKAEESRKKDLVAELERLSAPAEVVTLDEARLKRELRARISNAKGLLDRRRDEARQILRKLLDQPLRFEVFEDELGRKGYRVTGQGSYLQLLPGSLARTTVETHSEAVGVPTVVSPTGFEPVLLA